VFIRAKPWPDFQFCVHLRKSAAALSFDWQPETGGWQLDFALELSLTVGRIPNSAFICTNLRLLLSFDWQPATGGWQLEPFWRRLSRQAKS